MYITRQAYQRGRNFVSRNGTARVTTVPNSPPRPELFTWGPVSNDHDWTQPSFDWGEVVNSSQQQEIETIHWDSYNDWGSPVPEPQVAHSSSNHASSGGQTGGQVSKRAVKRRRARARKAVQRAELQPAQIEDEPARRSYSKLTLSLAIEQGRLFSSLSN